MNAKTLTLKTLATSAVLTAALAGTAGFGGTAFADNIAPAPKPTQPAGPDKVAPAPQPTKPPAGPDKVAPAPQPTKPEGLGPADRELLSLVLTAQLDSGEVARVTGDKPDAVYVKVSRLKDGLGRAAGALLVARHHREDCAELDALLRDWDGQYSALWRKRIARHVDCCAECGASQKKAAGALFGIAGVGPILALATLRERCLGGASSPDMVPVWFELGWPVAEPWERKRRVAVMPLSFAAAVAAALVVLSLVLAKGEPTENLAVPLPTLAPTTPAVTTPAVLPPTAAATTTATPTTVRSATARPTTAKPVVKPSAAPSPTTTAAPPVPAPPRVALSLSETALQTSCGSPTTSAARATATGTGVTTTIRWNGTAPGSRTFPGSGSATVGPYSSVSSPSGTDTVTVTATVRDSLGRTATASRTLTVTASPCPQ